jgi:hypothetical protein
LASKQISVGVGIPMIIAGVILAFILAPIQADLKDTVEFVGSLIGILGVLIFIAGFLSRKITPIAS